MTTDRCDTMEKEYSDIINIKYTGPKGRERMPLRERAAQFAPFAALAGYEDALKESERETEELSYGGDEALAELDRRFAILSAHIAEKPEVVINYFVPDDRKSGGAYTVIKGRIRKIREYERELVMDDGTVLSMYLITGIECRLFDGYDI